MIEIMIRYASGNYLLQYSFTHFVTHSSRRPLSYSRILIFIRLLIHLLSHSHTPLPLSLSLSLSQACTHALTHSLLSFCRQIYLLSNRQYSLVLRSMSVRWRWRFFQSTVRRACTCIEDTRTHSRPRTHRGIHASVCATHHAHTQGQT